MVRCSAYRQMSNAGTYLMAITALNLILNVVAGSLFFLTKVRKSGGISFGLQCLGHVNVWLAFLIWTGVTHWQQVKMKQQSSMPYAELHFTWFFYLLILIVSLICLIIVGYIVLQEVMNYDSVKEEKAKRDFRMARIKAKYFAGAEPSGRSNRDGDGGKPKRHYFDEVHGKGKTKDGKRYDKLSRGGAGRVPPPGV